MIGSVSGDPQMIELTVDPGVGDSGPRRKDER